MTEKEFIKSCILQIPEFILKKFPAEFIGNAPTNKMKMPGRLLILGTELFGTYEILNAEGSVEFHVESLAEAKFILYANRIHSKAIEIPKDKVEVEKAVSYIVAVQYRYSGRHQRQFLKKINKTSA